MQDDLKKWKLGLMNLNWKAPTESLGQNISGALKICPYEKIGSKFLHKKLADVNIDFENDHE